MTPKYGIPSPLTHHLPYQVKTNKNTQNLIYLQHIPCFLGSVPTGWSEPRESRKIRTLRPKRIPPTTQGRKLRMIWLFYKRDDTLCWLNLFSCYQNQHSELQNVFSNNLPELMRKGFKQLINAELLAALAATQWLRLRCPPVEEQVATLSPAAMAAKDSKSTHLGQERADVLPGCLL